MRSLGGIIHGEWNAEKRRDKYGKIQRIARGPALVYGTLTKAPMRKQYKTKKGEDRTSVMFRIRIKKGMFVRATVFYGAACYGKALNLKKRDSVLVAGQMSAWTYTKRDYGIPDEDRICIDIYPCFIVTNEKGKDNAPPDPIFSNDDGPVWSKDEQAENYDYGDEDGQSMPYDGNRLLGSDESDDELFEFGQSDAWKI